MEICTKLQQLLDDLGRVLRSREMQWRETVLIPGVQIDTLGE